MRYDAKLHIMTLKLRPGKTNPFFFSFCFFTFLNRFPSEVLSFGNRSWLENGGVQGQNFTLNNGECCWCLMNNVGVEINLNDGQLIV